MIWWCMSCAFIYTIHIYIYTYICPYLNINLFRDKECIGFISELCHDDPLGHVQAGQRACADWVLCGRCGALLENKVVFWVCLGRSKTLELPLFRKEFLAANILQSFENSCLEKTYFSGMPISSVPTRWEFRLPVTSWNSLVHFFSCWIFRSNRQVNLWTKNMNRCHRFNACGWSTKPRPNVPPPETWPY